ncbi:ComEC/Rec2 family competence protein [Peribacillus glennii]|uniref:MBL fold metallo-hydrolase n=1 Tax=Peribacillus glennii TaxID=2303991 RepID=A0A372LGS2_9BACI|nr:hypothetical protein [Peribacillus glennii]RFU65513.1 hypothetical protein D0466_06425 [Peribacillus glennii]
MNLIFSLMLALTGLLPIAGMEPAVPEEIEKIDLNLMEKEYAVTFFDLGKGESSIIQGAGGSAIMINTGAAEDYEELKKWLRLYGVKHIDSIILTSSGDGYDGNVKDIVDQYNVARVIAGKGMNEKVNGLLSDFPDIEIDFWNSQSKETFLDEIEIGVLHESEEGEEEGLDLSIKIRNNHLLYVTTSSQIIRNKLLALTPSSVQIVRAPFLAMPLEVAEHLDPHAVILDEHTEKPEQKEMVKKCHELWIEVFNIANQGTISTKFTQANHEIFPIRNFLHTKN